MHRKRKTKPADQILAGLQEPNKPYLKSQDSWGEVMKTFCRKAYCSPGSWKGLFHLLLPMERDQRTQRLLQEAVIVQIIWCPSSYLLTWWEPVHSCTSKSLTAALQSGENVLVWVCTFIFWRKAAAQIAAGCCFLGFWIPWIHSSTIILPLEPDCPFLCLHLCTFIES